jgi:hypothetical protein
MLKSIAAEFVLVILLVDFSEQLATKPAFAW